MLIPFYEKGKFINEINRFEAFLTKILHALNKKINTTNNFFSLFFIISLIA